MSHHPNPSTPHRLQLGWAWAVVAAALAACGGGEDDDLPRQAAATAATAGTVITSAAHPVSVQGCVVDRHFIPHTGTPVRALSADGRLLASAVSDGQGRFELRLPAGGEVTLAIDRPDGESQPLRVHGAAVEATRCLLDEQA